MKHYEVTIENCAELEQITSKILEGESFEKIVIRGGGFRTSSMIEFATSLTSLENFKSIHLEFNSNAGLMLWHLMSSLQSSLSLKKIEINCTNISDEGLNSVADFLKFNSAIQSLKISCPKGNENYFIKIAESLKSNTSLKKFVLSTHPYLSDKCVRSFLECLYENSSLIRIDLSSNNTRLLENIDDLCRKNEIIQRSAL